MVSSSMPSQPVQQRSHAADNPLSFLRVYNRSVNASLSSCRASSGGSKRMVQEGAMWILTFCRALCATA